MNISFCSVVVSFFTLFISVQNDQVVEEHEIDDEERSLEFEYQASEVGLYSTGSYNIECDLLESA